jgi:hypothetical protein
MNIKKCNIAFDSKGEENKYLIRQNAVYCLDASNNKLYETIYYSVNKRKIIKLILIVVVIVFALLKCIIGKHQIMMEEIVDDNYELSEEIESSYEMESKMVTDDTMEIYRRCSTEYFEPNELYEIINNDNGEEQIQRYINIIYAKYGYIFKEGSDNDIYFRSMDWYVPKGNVTYEELNIYERYNIDLLVEVKNSTSE